MQIIPITKLIMDDICKNKSDAYQVAFYKIQNFEIEKKISLNLEQNNCNKFRINDLNWLKNQKLLDLPDVLIMKSSTKLTEEENQLLIDLNIKAYYISEEILSNKNLFNITINEIERRIYKSKSLKYFEIEKQVINDIEQKYKDEKINNDELQQLLIKELLDLIKNKDEITYNHVKNVSDYADIFIDGIPENEKLDENQITFLKRACLLHDIGKLTIPNQILNKTDDLSNNKYNDINKNLGENAYLFNLKLMEDYKEIALCHHERYDGRGYPRGLKKDEIPYYSRIISVLDTFEELTGNRKKTLYEALSIIGKNAGTRFDPKVVEYFIRGIAKNQNFQTSFSLNEGVIAK